MRWFYRCTYDRHPDNPNHLAGPDCRGQVVVDGHGLVRCGIIPDWGCAYFIDIQGADGIVHEGWFAHAVTESPSPATGVLGDVPTELAPGSYVVTFLQRRVEDVASFAPVAGGTPRMTNRTEVLAKCATTVDVSGAIRVAFREAACTASVVATPRR